MNSTKTPQKKNIVTTTIYAVIIGLLVLACAITIALVSTKQKTSHTADVGGEDGEVVVSTVGYVLPMKDATIIKDYSATEHQFNDTLKQWEVHKAIDFKVGDNADVMSIADGTVSEVYTNYLEGTVIKIKHSDGLVSVYKSLDKNVNVKVGSKVSAGTVIGKASSSMAEEVNSGDHLHFQVELGDDVVDPYDYISLGDK